MYTVKNITYLIHISHTLSLYEIFTQMNVMFTISIN